MNEKTLKDTVELDKGWLALLNTGQVPEGYEFKTNVSKSPATPNITTESVARNWEDRGYDVVVLSGLGFDKEGRPTGADAIIARKRESVN